MNYYTRGFYYGLLNLQTHQTSQTDDVWLFCDKDFMHIPFSKYDIYGHHLDVTNIYFHDSWRGVSVKLKQYSDLFKSPETHDEKKEWMLGFCDAQSSHSVLKINNKKSFHVVSSILFDLGYEYTVDAKQSANAIGLSGHYIYSFCTRITIH